MNDLELAKDLSQKYAPIHTSSDSAIDFDIKILTTSYWPSYKTFELSVPREINDCMESFKNFYKVQQVNAHKELKWNFAMGTAVVTAKFGKTYELIVSTYQMCILSLFNFYEKLTIEEIIEHMGFDQETAKKNMQSLSKWKQARILKHQDGYFSVDKEFSS